MTNIKSRIMRAAEFQMDFLNKSSFAYEENQRLRPLIEALAEAVEALEGYRESAGRKDSPAEIVLANLERVVGGKDE